MKEIFEFFRKTANETKPERRHGTDLHVACLAFCADAMKITIGHTPYKVFKTIQESADQLYSIICKGYIARGSSDELYVTECLRCSQGGFIENQRRLAEQLGFTVEQTQKLYEEIILCLENLESE